MQLAEHEMTHIYSLDWNINVLNISTKQLTVNINTQFGMTRTLYTAMKIAFCSNRGYGQMITDLGFVCIHVVVATTLRNGGLVSTTYRPR